jgi:hypothetical protein
MSMTLNVVHHADPALLQRLDRALEIAIEAQDDLRSIAHNLAALSEAFLRDDMTKEEEEQVRQRVQATVDKLEGITNQPSP